jgi:hypothetical protein
MSYLEKYKYRAKITRYKQLRRKACENKKDLGKVEKKKKQLRKYGGKKVEIN